MARIFITAISLASVACGLPMQQQQHQTRPSGFPAHFSFRTVHNPFNQQAQNTAPHNRFTFSPPPSSASAFFPFSFFSTSSRGRLFGGQPQNHATPSETFFFRKAQPDPNSRQTFVVPSTEEQVVSEQPVVSTDAPIVVDATTDALVENQNVDQEPSDVVVPETPEQPSAQVVKTSTSSSKTSTSTSSSISTPTKLKSHVPVMVPVPRDFKGDVVVVSPEQLKEFGINGRIVLGDKLSKVVTRKRKLSTTTEMIPETTPMPMSQPQDETSPASDTLGDDILPLAQSDDSFVLTDNTDVQISDSESQTLTTIPVEVQTSAPSTTTQSSIPSTTPEIHAETFNAYNTFLNTWLQLASVNLNRPDLLNLLTPNIVKPTVQEASEIVSTPTDSKVKTEVVKEAEPAAKSLFLSEIESEPFQTLTDLPKEDVVGVEIIEPVTDQVIETVEPVTELILVSEAEEIPAAPEVLTEQEIFSTPEVLTTIDEAIGNMDSEASPQNLQQTESKVSPFLDAVDAAEDLNTLVTPTQEEVIEDKKTVVTPKVTAEASVSAHVSSPPVLLNAIPRITSRGRISGFRYSVSHQPQRGTYFFNNFAMS